ncbi:hypothetical protein [Streptacidiphilus sp. P02-A3a]|uniref:hypothetical protein n=1 Tax=Streptacidiphilus sp. P02-A3a TaxID=2704468 RepID=UPI0015FDA473|nr:hypothetical protein [Streptacidiphilus sp. P02-A3a]QMU68845.1 hypothetical protein GXP74_12000 [Streptacidiphilus sp. P02-A3a]
MDLLAVDGTPNGGARHLDLEPFWPSRQPFHFDETCCRSTGAQDRPQPHRPGR